MQFAPRNTFVAKAQKSENTDGTSSNATLDAKYSSRVRTAPSQLCPRDLNREGVRIQVEQDIHSILHNKILPQLKLEGNSETNPAASCNELLGRGQNSGYYWIHANGTSAVEIYCDMNRQFWWLGVCSLPQHDRPHTAMSRSVERSHNSSKDLRKSCLFQHKFSCIQHFWDTLRTIVCVEELLGTSLEHLKHFGFMVTIQVISI